MLGHQGLCIWLCGLSGSGKSTLAHALERRLHDAGVHCVVLDGDVMRTGLNKGLGFSEADRMENIRRAAEVARLFVRNGTVVIAAFITPMQTMRDRVREIIGVDDLLDVFVDAPLDECERRDVKGLYRKARNGEVDRFTGLAAPFEPPADPGLHLHTARMDAEACLSQLWEVVMPRIQPR